MFALMKCAVDFFLACQESKREDRDVCCVSPKQCQKTLSWLARIAILPHLQALINMPLIKASVSDDCAKERKEALPLPLYVVTQWEQYVISDECNDAFCTLLGGFLLAVHASLRFGDFQRIKWHSVALSWASLRGACWARKTMAIGQPYAILAFQDAVTQLGSHNSTHGGCGARLHAALHSDTLSESCLGSPCPMRKHSQTSGGQSECRGSQAKSPP